MPDFEDEIEPITTIQTLKNGPYIVRGVFTLTDSDGSVVAPDKDTIALCRCGASADKPFCDGTHSRIGFMAAAEVVPESEE